MTRRSTVSRALEMLEELPDDAGEIRRRVVTSMRLLDLADASGVLGLSCSSGPGRTDITWSEFDGAEATAAVAARASSPETSHLAWCLVDLRRSPRVHRRRFHNLGEIYDRERAIESPTWQEIYAPSGVTDQTRLIVTHDGCIVGFAFLLRLRGAPNFSSDPRLQKLVPRIRTALVAAHAISARPDEPGDFVVDPDGRVLFASESGRRWIAFDGFREWLRHRVREVDEGGEAAPPPDPTFGATPVIARVTGTEGVRYMVHVAPPPPPLRLSPLASLSPAQQEVAELAGAGATLAEIARMTGRSRETVRSHLRVVYERLQVCSRAELGRITSAG